MINPTSHLIMRVYHHYIYKTINQMKRMKTAEHVFHALGHP